MSIDRDQHLADLQAARRLAAYANSAAGSRKTQAHEQGKESQ